LQRKERLKRELKALELKQKELAIAVSEAEKAVEEQNPTVKKEMGDNLKLMASTAALRGIGFAEMLAEVLTEEQLRQLLQKTQAPAATAAEPAAAAAIPEPAAAAAAAIPEPAAAAAAAIPEPAAAAAAEPEPATPEPVAAETPDIHLQRAKKKVVKKADKEQ
jgi:Rod binding domain-containing protein